MTRYPKKGKGAKWTVKELQAIPSDWRGDTLSDGEGLTGDVRLADDHAISVRFRYAFRWEDKVCWFQCGSWPTVSLEQIRDRRNDARQRVKAGINPNDRKRADRIEAQREVESILASAAIRKAEDATVQDLFDAWIVDGVVRSDGNAELRRSFEKDVLPAIGAKPVRLLTEQDLRSLLRAMVARGVNRMAVRVRNDVTQMLDWAEKRQPWRKLMQEGNPADLIEIEKIIGPDVDPNEERTRILSAVELRELQDIFVTMTEAYNAAQMGQKYAATRPLQPTSQVALWICLSTTCRIGELLLTEWKHVDLQCAQWFIPKENAKGARGRKQDQTVFLSPFSLRQFKALHQLTGKTSWCFPARDKEGPVDLKSVSKQIGDRQERFKARRPLKNRRHDNTLVLAAGANGEWTPHDLRRTGATMMQALGVSLDVIDRCQNHILAGSRVRRHYLHHDYASEKREAWLRLGEHIEAILQSSRT